MKVSQENLILCPLSAQHIKIEVQKASVVSVTIMSPEDVCILF